MKLRTKMFLIYTLIAIIPVLVVGCYSYIRWRSYITEQVSTYSANISHNAIEQSNNTLDRIKRTLNFITYYSDNDDFSIIEILSEFSDAPGDYTSYDVLQASKRTESIFSNLMNTDTDLQGIYLITPSGLILGTSNDQSSQIDARHDCRSDTWYLQTIALNSKYYIASDVGDALFTDSNPSIYIARSIYDVYSHKFLGVILIDLNPEALDLDNLITIPDLALLSISNTQTGEVLYSNVDQLDDATNVVYDDHPQQIALHMTPLELSIAFCDDTLYNQYNPALVVIALLVVIFCLAILLSMQYITRRITFPIERLSRVMKHQQSGTQFVNPYVGRRDEIGTLYREYGNMLEEINASIRRDYQNRILVLDAQMKALEARINSHFLFNTLESINSMAELEDNHDIAVMSLALGDMFRYAIKTPSELVTLADEIKHVEDYVSIQRIRFSDQFRLIKEIPPDLERLSVLKLILQPLVENALYHGLNYCTSGDAITISARREEGLLHITVADNGVGIAPDALAALRDSLEEESAITEIGKRTGQSIGLRNIHSRIRLYYGEIYGLAIESREGGGTAITITIPVKE